MMVYVNRSFVRVASCCVEVSKVIPPVVGEHVGGNGEGSLETVEHALHKDGIRLELFECRNALREARQCSQQEEE